MIHPEQAADPRARPRCAETVHIGHGPPLDVGAPRPAVEVDGATAAEKHSPRARRRVTVASAVLAGVRAIQNATDGTIERVLAPLVSAAARV